MLYEQVEPFGELREDWRAAAIRATIFNMSGRMSKDQRPMEEFLLKFVEKTKPVEQTVDDQIRIMNIWAAAMTAG